MAAVGAAAPAACSAPASFRCIVAVRHVVRGTPGSAEFCASGTAPTSWPIRPASKLGATGWKPAAPATSFLHAQRETREHLFLDPLLRLFGVSFRWVGHSARTSTNE